MGWGPTGEGEREEREEKEERGEKEWVSRCHGDAKSAFTIVLTSFDHFNNFSHDKN